MISEFDLTTEKEAFTMFKKAFGLCFEYVRHEYDLRKYIDGKVEKRANSTPLKHSQRMPNTKLSSEEEKKQRYYDEELPQQIKGLVETFNWKATLPKLMKEIKGNLEICAGRGTLSGYIPTLLEPFSEFSKEFYPYVFIKQQQENYARNYGNDDDSTLAIDYAEHTANGYRRMLKDNQGQSETVEYWLSVLVTLVHIYADRLDDLLHTTSSFKAGEDLDSYQNSENIYLRSKKQNKCAKYQPIHEADPFIDEPFFTELPYIESMVAEAENLEKKAVTETAQQEADSQNAEASLPKALQNKKALQNEKAQYIFKEAKEAGLIDENYKWLKTKRLCVYFSNKMSRFLELTAARVSKDRRELQTAWQPFEQLFGYSNMRIDNNHITQFGNPLGSDKVDNIFNKAKDKFKKA